MYEVTSENSLDYTYPSRILYLDNGNFSEESILTNNSAIMNITFNVELYIWLQFQNKQQNLKKIKTPEIGNWTIDVSN